MPQSLLDIVNELDQQKKQSQPQSLTAIADEISGLTPFDPNKAPELNTLGKAVDPIIQAGKSGALKILDLIGRPQQALYGAALGGGIQTPEGREAARQGLMGERHYTGRDILEKDKILSDSPKLQTIAGLGLDLVGDPVNLAGVGPVAKGLSKAVDAGTKAVKQLPLVKPVAKFIDPHADLESVKGLKEFARLNESEARAIRAQVHNAVGDVVAQKSRLGDSLIKSFDAPTLEKIAYAMDAGDLSKLNPAELNVAKKAKNLLDEQWNSEVYSGHQSVPLKTSPLKNPAPRIADYVPYVTKPDAQRNVGIISDVKGTSRFSEPRKYQTLQEAVTQGNADPNLANMLQARLTTGRLAQHGTRIVEDAITRFGSRTPNAGMRELNTKFVSLPEQFKNATKGVYFEPKVADYIERAHTIMSKPDEVKNAWQNTVKVFKSWLVTNPQQVVTNLLGNTINAAMSGTTPSLKNLNLARKIVLGHGAPNAGKYSSAEIMNAMQKWEIIGGAGQFQDVVHAGKNYSWNMLRADNVPSKVSQFVNQHVVEEPFKVAQFLTELEKGSDLETAALKVKDTFFDYAEISDSAKFLRDNGLVPFITWQIKNVPLQIDTLLKRPQKFAQTESVYDTFTDSDQIVPHQDQREGLLPFGNNKLMRFASPINDLNKLPIGDYEQRDLAVDTLGQMAPWYKALIELGFNEKIYNGQPVVPEDGSGVIPFDGISRGLDMVGLGALAGIGEDEQGQIRQNPYMAYVLQQNPWQYYARNILGPPEELVEKGAMQPGSTAGNLIGFRTKETSPSQEMKELRRRLNMMAP